MLICPFFSVTYIPWFLTFRLVSCWGQRKTEPMKSEGPSVELMSQLAGKYILENRSWLEIEICHSFYAKKHPNRTEWGQVATDLMFSERREKGLELEAMPEIDTLGGVVHAREHHSPFYHSGNGWEPLGCRVKARCQRLVMNHPVDLL